MFLGAAPPSDDADRQFGRDVAEGGYVMNLTRAWAWRPDIAAGFLDLRQQLMSRSRLTRRHWVIVACASVSTLGDAYCSLSFGTVLASMTDASTAASVLRGDDPPTLTDQERAMIAWARRMTRDPNAMTPEDAAALRAAGLGDREIFELTAFVAFRLAFAMVNDALGVPPDRELADSAPREVQDAVAYGRPPAPPRATYIPTGSP